MHPGVVAQLDLSRLHQGCEQVVVIGPGLIHPGDEHRQPDPGVDRELGVRPHHRAVDAVVEGQREQVAVAGQ